MRRFPLVSLALTAFFAICACASALESRVARDLEEQNALDAYNRSVAPEDRLQCFWRIPVGSSIKKKVCLTAAQIEREHRKARAFVSAGHKGGQTEGNRGRSR